MDFSRENCLPKKCGESAALVGGAVDSAACGWTALRVRQHRSLKGEDIMQWRDGEWNQALAALSSAHAPGEGHRSADVATVVPADGWRGCDGWPSAVRDSACFAGTRDWRDRDHLDGIDPVRDDFSEVSWRSGMPMDDRLGQTRQKHGTSDEGVGVDRALPTAATVHLVVYEHRFGLDISVHASAQCAREALTDTATAQCARDPVIRAAVCERFGNWPASGFTEREMEELLDDWSELASGERLWTTECIVLGASVSSHEASSDDDAATPFFEDPRPDVLGQAPHAVRSRGETSDAEKFLRDACDGGAAAGASGDDGPPSIDHDDVRSRCVGSGPRPSRGPEWPHGPSIAPTERTVPYDILDTVIPSRGGPSER